jgi:hypothetical protein
MPAACLALLALIAAAAACVAAPWAAADDAPPSREYQLKAAFIYNFAKFVEWPDGTFAAAGDPLVIGIIGDDPFNGALDQAIKGKTVGGHPLVIRQITAGKEKSLKACQVVFVPASQDQNLDTILAAVKGAGILTVGESEKYVRAGGVIRLYLEDNKVRFEISQRAARAARLIVSAKLLKLAKLVDG